MTRSELLAESIELQDFRRFPKLLVELEPDLTVLVSDNAGGKTSVLDALAIILGAFVGAIDGAGGKSILASDARRLRRSDVRTTELAFPVSVEAEIQLGGQSAVARRSLNSAGGKTTSKDARALRDTARELQSLVRQGSDVELPLIAYYGTGRLWNELRDVSGRRPSTSRLAGYVTALKPGSTFRAAAQWLEWATLAKLQEEDAAGATVDAVLSAVAAATEGVMWRNDVEASITNVRYSVAEGSVVGTSAAHDVALPVEVMSDGARTTLGLVLDLAWRAAVLNPHLGAAACKAAHGVVLIDEVDLHLHPSWQQRILTDLRAVFPGIQFIVSTHSPQVLSSVDARCVRILDDERLTESWLAPRGQVRHTLGRESNDVMLDVQSVEARAPGAATERLSRYRQLVEAQEWDSSEAQELRRLLEGDMGSSDPALIDADRFIQLERLRKEL